METESQSRNGTRGVGLVAVEAGVQTAGAITWWALSGPVDATALDASWREAGLDPELLPLLPSPESALRRAIKDQEHRHRLARQNQKGSWALVDESVQDDGQLSYVVPCAVAVNVAGQLEFGGDWILSVRGEVVAAYEGHLSQLSTVDVSSWLCRLVDTCQAVSLREHGGMYFVPRDHVPGWRAMATAIKHASGHQVYEVPALKSNEAVEAILAAVEAEAEREAELMEADLNNAELGERALARREERCRAVEQKVASYEALLGSKLDVLRVRLDRVRANLAIRLLSEQKEAE